MFRLQQFFKGVITMLHRCFQERLEKGDRFLVVGKADDASYVPWAESVQTLEKKKACHVHHLHICNEVLVAPNTTKVFRAVSVFRCHSGPSCAPDIPDVIFLGLFPSPNTLITRNLFLMRAFPGEATYIRSGRPSSTPPVQVHTYLSTLKKNPLEEILVGQVRVAC